MRTARSYSIVDHQLYHGGYLHRLSHEAMALYLFLAVVGDREGRSFYGEASLCEILRLTSAELNASRAALLGEGLIDYRKPYWWVRSLERRPMPASLAPPPGACRDSARDPAEDNPRAQVPVDREAHKQHLREILAALRKRRRA